MQAINATRPGRPMGFVGVNYEVSIPHRAVLGRDPHTRRIRAGAPVLIRLIWDRKIDPGKVFDLTPPLERAREATSDERGHPARVLLTL